MCACVRVRMSVCVSECVHRALKSIIWCFSQFYRGHRANTRYITLLVPHAAVIVFQGRAVAARVFCDPVASVKTERAPAK